VLISLLVVSTIFLARKHGLWRIFRDAIETNIQGVVLYGLGAVMLLLALSFGVVKLIAYLGLW
jgi:hypothetical protein